MGIHVVFILAVVVLSCTAEEKYTNRFDSFDIDKVLGSDRLLNNYHKCLLDQGPCTPAGTELKKHIPDALKTDCSKCSKVQKEKSLKVTDFLINKRPKMFKDLEKKYDPTGIYRAREEKKRGSKIPV